MSVMKRVRRDMQHEGCDSGSFLHRQRHSVPPVAGYCRVINKAEIATDWDTQEQGDVVVTQPCQTKKQTQTKPAASCFPSVIMPQDFVHEVSVLLLQVTWIKRDFAKLTVCKEFGCKEQGRKEGRD